MQRLQRVLSCGHDKCDMVNTYGVSHGLFRWLVVGKQPVHARTHATMHARTYARTAHEHVDMFS